ncbi:MAG: flagellar filament capping protein FliD [Pirellulaceae bacterium]|nr:flagellar filament capping protein FliD [Pirellulaceae bacterium]
MGRIQSNIGLITGTNITSTVDQLVAISAIPRDRLQARVKSYEAQQIALNELTATIIGIELQSTRLGTTSTLSSINATSSVPDSVSVRNTGSPVPGNYSLRTLQTAQTSAAASNTFTSASETIQAGEFVVRTGGFVDSTTVLDELRGGAGIARGKFSITDRSGTSREIDLSGAVTIEDVVKKINSTDGLKVNAKTDGDRIVLTDISGSTTSNLKVEEVDSGRTAAELGFSGIDVASSSATGDDLVFLTSSTRLHTLRDGRGIAFGSGDDLNVTLKDGTSLNIDLNATKAPATIGQMLTAINAVNSTKLEARIQSNGNGIELIDKTSGTSSFAASGRVADQLGLTGVDGSSGTVAGTRIQSALQGPLLASLNGGQGLGTLGFFNIQNRAGGLFDVDLSGASSLREVIDRINQANAGVSATFNQSRTGISLQDTTGSTAFNLVIANGDPTATATKLKIAADVSSNTIDSNSLGVQFVSEGTALSKLNQGRGIRSGTFNITDSAGKQATINLTSANITTVGDLIQTINDKNIGVKAQLNKTGDGYILIDTANGSGQITITDSNGGNTALDLGIRGTSKVVTIDSVSQKQIESSQTFRLTFDGTETLTQVVEKLNAGNAPLTASLLTSGPSTVRLLFSSRASGEVGRIVAEGDGIGLSIANTTNARNAVLSFGSGSEGVGAIVQSSSNVFTDVISGLEITAKGTSSQPAQITVARSRDNIEKSIQLLVDQFNKAIDKIKKETSFDATTQTTGQLFGTSEVLRVEHAFSRFINSRTFGSGKVQSLSQLGVGYNDSGKLTFDKSKLSKQLETNASDVEDFFTKADTGFSARAKKVFDGLVGVKSSVLVNRNQAIQKNIENGNARIGHLNIRLDNERNRLLKQFYGMEDAIAKIKNNASALSNIQYISLSGQSSG